MTNNQETITNFKNYFQTWWLIIARPIYFYTKLKEANWREQSLTFLLVTAWLLAAAATLAIFIIQYIPIGSTLVQEVHGAKLILVLPVMVTLALVFFALTLLIVGGVLALGLGVGFYALGLVMHYTYIVLGGKGSLNRMVQSALYSSAIVLVGVFPVLFAMMTRYNLLDISLFRVGYNVVYGLTAIFIYGLWAVAGRKAYDLPKWKAWLGALVPVILLLIFGLAFDKIGIAKLESWIAPLK
jgi:hypothetical protein